jgi:methionyl aminopeptidase
MKKAEFSTYNEKEIEILRRGGEILHRILRNAKDYFVPGVRTIDIDVKIESDIRSAGAEPVFKNYKPEGAKYPFPASSCISINEEVAHGLPGERVVKFGDLVSLDVGIRYGGFVVDSAISFGVGELTVREKRLIDITEIACNKGIEKIKAGAHVNDIGKVIEEYVRSTGFTVVDILCGHAVGRSVHEEPYIPHIDMGYKGEMLKEGMVVAIEPHISTGNGKIYLNPKDNWTYLSKDGAKTAQFEHTVLVKKDGFEVLT